MTRPIVFFSHAGALPAPEPALAGLREIAELRRDDDPALLAEAAIVVLEGELAPELFGSRHLMAVLWSGAAPQQAAAAQASAAGVLLVRALPGGALAGQLRDILQGAVPEGAVNADAAHRLRRLVALPPETGGAAGPEPTRYGDWQHKGRVTDF